MDLVADKWQCNSCAEAFEYVGDPVEARCPSCGSEFLTRFIQVHEELRPNVSEHVVLKAKDPALPSKRKLRREVRSGVRPEGSGSGRLVREYRALDSDLDSCQERIVDIESGEVIRDVSGSLSDHRGGSEKCRK
jgi:predicted RNA-binding Zn-ribbon protein involved in translation (DUF1610 family)